MGRTPGETTETESAASAEPAESDGRVRRRPDRRRRRGRRLPLNGVRPADRERLLDQLSRARRLGFLGAAPVDSQLARAEAFAMAAAAVDAAPPERALDLGSGGGLPGLVLAALWAESSWVLLDAGERRTAFLTEAVTELGWPDRVEVRRERAERAGHDPELRGRHDLVVARSFGPPAVTAECAAPLLTVGGWLLVSEPPDAADTAERWDDAGLDRLGLRRGPAVHDARGPASIQTLVQVEPCSGAISTAHRGAGQAAAVANERFTGNITTLNRCLTDAPAA